MLLAAIDTQTQALTKESTVHRRETRHGTRDVNAGILALEQSLNVRLDDLATQDDIHRLTQHLKWLEELFQIHVSSQSRYSGSEDGSLLSERSLASECEVIMVDEGEELVVPTLDDFNDFKDDTNSSKYDRHHSRHDLEVSAPSTQTMLELDLSLDDECCDESLLGLNICVAEEVPLVEARTSAPEETTTTSAEIVCVKDAPAQIAPTDVQRNPHYRYGIPLLIAQCLCLYGLYTCCWWSIGGYSPGDNAQLNIKNSEGFVNTKFVDLRLE